jgi:UDP-glucose 4-epimerase
MKSLILGDTGYIGKNLAQYFHLQGEDFSVPPLDNGKRIDLKSDTAVNNIDWNCDVVYMLAGLTGTHESFNNYKEFLLCSNLSLLNILDSIRKTPFRPCLVFPSSRLVYNGSEIALTEDSEQNSNTVYAANKIACENYLKAYKAAFGIPYIILRLGVPYGSMVTEGYSYGTTGSFIRQAKDSGVITLYGKGDAKRTFTHVEDICMIAHLAAKNPNCRNQIFNMPGDNISLLSAATQISRKFGASVINVSTPESDARIETGSTIFNGDKILNLLNTSLNHQFTSWVTSTL